MPLVHDPEIVRSLLLADEPGTRSIFNTVFGRTGADVGWMRVDDVQRPRAILIRSQVRHRRMMMYLHAADSAAAKRVLAELPARWRLQCAATPARFVRVARGLRKLAWVAPCYLYVLEPGKLVIDRTHRIEILRPEDAPLITRYWPHGKSEDYIRWRIESGPTCAVRRQGKLAAWALTHADGAMGILHVLDEYRGQGMARAITTALAQRLIKIGLPPFLYIVEKNQASITLTESMGFTRHGVYCWFGQ